MERDSAQFTKQRSGSTEYGADDVAARTSRVRARASLYEREVVFNISETRYIMENTTNLAFLERVFRYRCHHNFWVRLVT